MINWAIIGAEVFALFMIFIITFSWFFARLWCKPRRKNHTEGPDSYNLDYESIRFKSKDVPLNGWFIPAEKSRGLSPALILVHGWSSNAADVLPLAGLLHQAGYAVLLFNARGHGNSGADGPITMLKFAEDIISSINYLETRKDIDREKLGVVGHSLGASATIVAAARDARIKVAVSCSAFADPVQLTHETMQKLHLPRGLMFRFVIYFIERWIGTSMGSIAPKHLIRKVKADLLLVHGDSDHFVDSDNLEILYAQADKDKTEMRLIRGAGHADLIKQLCQVGNPLTEFINRKMESHGLESCH